MDRMIGAREICEYAQKYNMPVGKGTPLSMGWCFDMADKAYELGKADAIDKCKQLIKARITDNLGLANATKYGNKNAEQQANSYSTVMKYEIADCVEDLLDDLEQLKL